MTPTIIHKVKNEILYGNHTMTLNLVGLKLILVVVRFKENDVQPNVNESFELFPDWGGCIFLDTMSVGSGNFEKLNCGLPRIIVPKE